MEILAGEQGKVHIAACLGLAPLVELAIKSTRLQTVRSRLLGPIGLTGGGLRHVIPLSQCTLSLLKKPDKNGNIPPALDIREPMPISFLTFNQKGFNDKNRSGDTPLHLAFQFDHIDIVKGLLKNGADPTIKNNAQLTAFELGEKLGRVYNLREAREGTVEIPVEGPGRKL